MNKKKILITWDSRRINEVLCPLIEEWGGQYDIFILAIQYFSHLGVEQLLCQWQAQGLIKHYLILPTKGTISKGNIFVRHFEIFHLVKKLRGIPFDGWLTTNNVQVVERYISSFVLSAACKRFAFCSGTTYLFERPDIVRPLLNDGLPLAQVTEGVKPLSIEGPSLIEKLREKWTHHPSLLQALGMNAWLIVRGAFKVVKRGWKELFSRIYGDYLDRRIFPYFVSGRFFTYGPHDHLTQIGSGALNAVMFCDPLEVRVHEKFYKNIPVILVNHPSCGFCHCQGQAGRSRIVLAPLSGFLSRATIPEKYLVLFYRDFKVVMERTGSSLLHLRDHPSGSGGWGYQLQGYLRERGIDSEVVGCERPIREITCQYSVVAGFCSGALRDARASCQFTRVIAFAGVSQARYADPKFVFASSEGIGWIEKDGSFDDVIFQQTQYQFQQRNRIVEVINRAI